MMPNAQRACCLFDGALPLSFLCVLACMLAGSSNALVDMERGGSFDEDQLEAELQALGAGR